jgi:bifunctional non-homologous end joining protein LigD
MALEEYNKKRDFQKTYEPEGKFNESSGEQLRFVIQKHQATHLHYDFRIELNGVLKSWAIPKGPSLDPHQKRLAVMVEDHPFDYRNFEGTIPEGNYGAGTVIIWDEGSYYVPSIKGRNETENYVTQSIESGNILFLLSGKKLNGAFHLVQTKRASDGKSWLLIKKEDQFSSSADVLLLDRSVRTGRTIEDVALHKAALDIDKLEIEGAKKSPFPSGPITPMFAQLVESPFNDPQWIFEVKWDGYRAIAEVKCDGTVALYSRNGTSFIRDYPEIVKELSKLQIDAIFDGEIVVTNKDGKADFGLIQNYKRRSEGYLLYYIFDLLFINGFDIKGLALHKRKEILQRILPQSPHLKYNDHIEGNGVDFFQAAKAIDIEGIIAKDKNSTYQSGIRSRQWQKIKIHHQQEVVIGGYTEPKGGRKDLGSLAVGVYENGALQYVGNVGGGFTDEELPEVKKKLVPLIRNSSPFKNLPESLGITWVEPVLVCEVKFSEWTSEGILRQPIFLGFREDISAFNVQREKASSFAKPSFQVEEKDKILHIGSHVLKFTNVNKVYWPDENITKGELIEYYQYISPYILPHLIDRPESLHRFPDGIYGKEFFHKDIEDAPDWVKILEIPSESQEGSIHYILCQDQATLLYMVNLGALEINPWNSRAQSLDNPDYMVIDLDPVECPFEYVIKSALITHDLLMEIDIAHYIKTSGATGIHIFVPLGASYSYDQVRQFAQIICLLVNRRLPEITSLERLPKNRKGKVYLDYLQNIKGKTMASVYSLRPRPKAPVSTPLHWDEVKEGILPDQFTIKEIIKRIEKFGDLWKDLPGKKIDMQRALNSLEHLFGPSQ